MAVKNQTQIKSDLRAYRLSLYARLELNGVKKHELARRLGMKPNELCNMLNGFCLSVKRAKIENIEQLKQMIGKVI